LTLHSPSRTSLTIRTVARGRRTFADSLPRPSSRRIFRPFGAPSPRNPLPGTVSSPGPGLRFSPPVRSRSSHLGSRSGGPAVPRRGVPIPLRSAFAVSHDLDGFCLLGPGGVFHPLTPLGFGSRLPVASSGRSVRRPAFPVLARVLRTEVRATRMRGASDRSGGSRSTAHRTDAEASTLIASSPLPLPKELVRFRLPILLPGLLRFLRPPRCPLVRIPVPDARDRSRAHPGHRVGEPPRCSSPIP
jgi:hypothetical protein